jgi:hypothetical protein
MHNQFDPENRQWCGEWPIVTTPTPEPEPTPEPTPEPGLITRVERVAQEGLSIGEMITEGVSPWTLASWGIALIAAVARKFRKS